VQDPTYVHAAFSGIAPRYVLVNHVCSLGIDLWWRHRFAQRAARLQPQRILDLATGSGDLAMALWKKCPQATIIATDFCEPMLEHARKRGLPDVRVADAMNLPFADASHDLVTVGFGLRNMADYAKAVREMSRVLTPGGHLMILDFSQPTWWMAPFYKFHLHYILPTVAGLISGKKDAYTYLGQSIETFPSGEKMKNLLQENGYGEIEWQPFTGHIASMYVARKM
jgi:demethylmenaquinone methyltransferase / 2-methoxy-6-polyprenyl-1,4-benzoquinol methylase